MQAGACVLAVELLLALVRIIVMANANEPAIILLLVTSVVAIGKLEVG